MLFRRKKEKTQEVKEEVLKESYEEFLVVDYDMGLANCGNMKELYAEVTESFCAQYQDLSEKMDTYVKESDWKQYARVAHTLKGNALTMGATAFSELSLQHEHAGKEENAEFIKKEYPKYIAILKELVEKIEKSEF